MTQHILITGATSGIGYQLALDYLQLGNVVHVVGRNASILDELSALGAIAHKIELTDRMHVIATLGSIERLDIAICCAGMCHYIDINATDNHSINTPIANNKTTDIDSTEQEESNSSINFDSAKMMDVMDVNYGTLVHTIEAVLPLLKQSRGRLLAIGSASAYVPFTRAEAYGSSKSAVHYLMQTLAMSLKPHGINVSLIVPGFVETPMTAKNDFPMPFLQTTKQASRAIQKGIENNDRFIEFPKRLTAPLKILGILPNTIWYKVSDNLYKNR